MLLLPLSVFAQESAGVTPHSRLWKLDLFFEKLNVMFADSDEKIASLHLKHAEERLAEIEAVQDNDNEVDAAEQERQHSINEVEKHSKNLDKDTAAVIQEATQTHIAALEAAKQRVPEHAKEKLQHAIEQSTKSHEKIKEHEIAAEPVVISDERDTERHQKHIEKLRKRHNVQTQ